MRKTSGKPHRRAYINPVPGFPEAAQRAAIEQHYDDIAEWYIESKSLTRADFIDHLRPGDEAIVARAGCFAKSKGTSESRLADMAEARGDVQAKCALLISADNPKRNSRDHWPAMKAAAKVDLLAFKNMANGSARQHSYTDQQLRDLLIIGMNPKLTNWPARVAEMKRKKIPLCGRTWFIEKLPLVAAARGVEI